MAQRIHLKDTVTELRVFSARLVFAAFAILLLSAILVARYFILQVVDYEHYSTQSDNNRIHVRSVAPTRGLVFDRNGVMLAENLPSFSLTVTRERVKDLAYTLDTLKGLIAISDEEIERFEQQLARRRPFESVPLRFQLTESERAAVAVNQYRLPGVEIEAQLYRHYPLGSLFAHVVGYVGRINEAELRTIDPANYASTHHIGKIGVERVYEDLLHGLAGSEQVETTAQGKVQRVLDRRNPVPGRNLTLTLDVHVQQVAEDALGEGRGAVVAVDPVDGDVIALVSKPGFDPNLFVRGISTREYSALRNSPDQPLFNRALQGQYPPASTIKPIFALAGLEYGVIDVNSTFFDPGWFQLPGDKRKYRDWKKWGHGQYVGLQQAIAESCDVYFYNLAYRLGIQKLHDFAVLFGLGSLTGIDLTAERSGLIPSNAWKLRTRGVSWYPGETLSAGIGQGYMLVTPLQLAMMGAAIATHGHRVKPKVLKAIDGVAASREALPDVPVRNELHWQAVISAMQEVVHGPRGTARGIALGAPFRIGGKTGTAQVVGIARDEEHDDEEVELRERDHSLFVAFAPAANPQIAVAAIIENAAGGVKAAPLVRKIIDAWMSTRPLSPATMEGV